MTERGKGQTVQQALRLAGRDDEVTRQILELVWDAAFEQGRLAALDEFQDRFCVCMK